MSRLVAGRWAALILLVLVGCASAPYAQVVTIDHDTGIFTVCGTGGLKEKAAQVCPTAQVHQCELAAHGTETCCVYTCEVAR